MYAIIETGGKQYQVKEGDVLFIEKLAVEADAAIDFDKVVAVSADDGMKIGAPYVDGAVVSAKVLKNGKGKKINILTYKPKKGSTMKRQGHRQPYTQVQIEAIKA
ncbi:MAG: 50S ribosomal protein L21 [Oscillospiraceae bacterium]|nr:50S ribosomal protein L21 [Oscillospiraceae bacterium]